MKTRILIFKTAQNSDNSETNPGLIYFYVNKAGFETNLSLSLDDFAQQNFLIRKIDFDWAVGDAGAKCALFEADMRPLDNKRVFADLAQGGDWLNFPQAVKILSDGEDKRYLQLAVQYLAAGGINESVIASDYDQEFLNTLKEALLEKTNSDNNN